MSRTLIDIYEAEGYNVASPAAVYGRSSRLETGVVEYDGGYREASAEEVYGYFTTLDGGSPVEPATPHLTAEPVFHIVIAITLIAYLYMLLRSWKFINVIYGDMLNNHSERRMESQGGALPLQHFKRGAMIIGALVVALIFVRLGDNIIPATSPIYIKGIGELSVVFGIVAVIVLWAWLYALHQVIEWLTASDGAQTLLSIGSMNFVRMVVLLYHIAAVWLLADSDVYKISTIALIVCALPIVLLYLKETFLLFIGKKISILYWILYLCTAILLPLSFVLHLLPAHLG